MLLSPIHLYIIRSFNLFLKVFLVFFALLMTAYFYFSQNCSTNTFNFFLVFFFLTFSIVFEILWIVLVVGSIIFFKMFRVAFSVFFIIFI